MEIEICLNCWHGMGAMKNSLASVLCLVVLRGDWRGGARLCHTHSPLRLAKPRLAASDRTVLKRSNREADGEKNFNAVPTGDCLLLRKWPGIAYQSNQLGFGSTTF